MRIRLYIPCIKKTINIQKIRMTKGINIPRVYFKCHEKYQFDINNEKVIFVDCHGKELFSCDRARLYFRDYEADDHIPKVTFEIILPQFEKYGNTSNEYIEKLLNNACNTLNSQYRKPKDIIFEIPKEIPKEVSREVHKRNISRILGLMRRNIWERRIKLSLKPKIFNFIIPTISREFLWNFVIVSSRIFIYLLEKLSQGPP